MRKLVFGLMVCSLLSGAEVSAVLKAGSARKAAPEFKLLDESGKSATLASFRGRPLVLNLWATKCGGCIKEIPSFVEVHQAYASQGLAVVGVSADIFYEDLKGPAEAWSLVKPFVAAHHIGYRILMGDGEMTTRYAVEALPVTYLIDRRGRIAATYEGVVDRANLEANVTALLAER